MIDKNLFEFIKRKYGGFASWAIWADEFEKPKSNINDLNVFDIHKNISLLNSLNNNIIMVGLNISRTFSEPFRNFHDPNPHANDFKLRFAFRNTEFYGAYMTDFIKDFEMVDSSGVLKYLKTNGTLIEKSTIIFREELLDLKAKDPIILALGDTSFNLINQNFKREEYSKLIKVKHYSNYISKEKYREIVINQIKLARSQE